MKPTTSRLASALLACGFLATSCLFAQTTPVAGPPALIDYQGLVFDGSGVPLGDTAATNYKMYFRIYDQSENGNLLWSEKQIVTVNSGQFSVRLGEGEPLEIAAGDNADEARPALNTVFDGSDRYLGVSVALVAGTNPTGEIVPRLAFLTAPFSFVSERAVTADSVLDGAIDSTKIDGSFALWEVNGGNTFLDNGGNIGVGTDAPDAKLHLRGGTQIDSAGGGGFFTIGNTSGNNLTLDNDEIQRYNNGVPSTLHLNARGGSVIAGNVSQDVRFGINGSNGNSTAYVRQVMGDTDIARFADSSDNNIVRILPGTALSLADNTTGHLVLGKTVSVNLAMDNDEIMARNNGGNRTLHLNREGGNVNIGTSAAASRFHVNGTSSASTFNVVQSGTDNNLARFVTSGGTEIARFMKGDSITLGGGDTGHLILGEPSGNNLVMDVNDIQARNNGSANALRLNPDGGNLNIGGAAKASHVGVNNTYPNITLNVRGIAGDQDFLRVEDDGGTALFSVNGSDVKVRGGASFDVTGGGAKNFLIDHPLDPKNKTLRHAAVEGPERMTIYHGSVTLDDSGKAVAELPDYFEALNKEFHYQLTCVGGFANVYVASEIEGNRFEIAGGNQGLKVCWQVTAVRDDASARAQPYIVEEMKGPEEAGRYLDPAAFGATASAE